jgi:hypothetical protein
VKGALILAFVVLLFGAPGAAMVVEGVSQYRTKTEGEKTTARITECRRVGVAKSRHDECRGTWIAGGELISGDGRVVVGRVEGASRGDEGKTIDVRLDGDKAYTTSLATPIFFVVFGGLLVALALFLLWSGLRRRAGPPPAA